MELFEFKRYLGDEKGLTSKQDDESGLDGYLERVKQRKRRREEQERSVEEVSPVNNDDGRIIDAGGEFTKKKKKKKFSENVDKVDVLSAHLNRVKLRKQIREEKLKKLDTCGDELEEVVDDSNVEIKNDVANGNETTSNLTSKSKKEKNKLKDVENMDDENDGEVSSNSLELSRKLKKEKKKNREAVNEDLNIAFEAAADEDGKKESNETEKPKSKKKKKKIKKVNDEKEVVQESSTTNIVVAEKQMQPVAFEVLGAHSFKDKVRVKRVLPRWLAEPTIISPDLSCGKSINEVGRLHYKLVQNLKDMGITDMFPVQLEVIPYQLKFNNKNDYLWPRDLCVAAPTGSGKTLAFALPLLQAYFSTPRSSLFALVIAPIQELALQVAQVFRSVAKGTGIKIGCITGGSDKDIEAKQLVCKRDDGSYVSLINILIATPGRLMQHFFLTPGFNLKDLKFIIIDEADRVVDQKSLNWLHLIEKQCNPTFNGNVPPVTLHNLKTCARGPQKLLFSATLSQDPEKLLKFNLFQPKLITSIVKKKTADKQEDEEVYCKFPTPSTIKELYAICNINKKPLLLHKLISDGWRRVIVFTKTCIEANRLCSLVKILNPEVKVGELSSLMILNKRQASVNNFSSGETSVLVCSDRMARGIDIKCVDYVIIYDPPKDVKGYIHKAGRTGRAGSAGTSIIILTQKQERTFFEMLKKFGKTDLESFEYDSSALDDFIPIYEDALTSLKSHVSAMKNESVNLSIREKRTKTIINLKRRKRKTALSIS